MNPSHEHERSKDYDGIKKGYSAPFIKEVLKGIPKAKNLSLLDLGTGTGLAAKALAPRFLYVLGLDPSAARIEQAKKAKTRAGVRFELGQAEQIPSADESHDCVTAGQCFQYFDHDLAMPEIFRVLKPGGKFAVFWKYPIFEAPIVKLAEQALKKSKVKSRLKMHGLVINSGVTRALKRQGYSQVKMRQVDTPYRFTKKEWIAFVLWAHGAGTPELLPETARDLELNLTESLSKKKGGPQVLIPFRHYLFEGFKK